MHYSYVLPAAIMGPAVAGTAVSVTFQHSTGRRAVQDRRWPAVVSTLARLRRRGRRSLRVVDVHCGAGEMLVQIARRARSLGFMAIEAYGVDRDARLIGAARRTAAAVRDPAIGLVFEQGGAADALEAERDFPADIVLFNDSDADDGALAAQAGAAGDVVLADHRDREVRGSAAA